MQSNYLQVIFKAYFNMKKIYFFITIAILLLVFNLTKIDFENIFSNDSKIGLTGLLACLCTIVLMVILFISKKIKNKKIKNLDS